MRFGLSVDRRRQVAHFRAASRLGDGLPFGIWAEPIFSGVAVCDDHAEQNENADHWNRADEHPPAAVVRVMEPPDQAGI